MSNNGAMFHEEFVAKQAMHYNMPAMTKYLSDELNERLESAIRDAGDYFAGRNTSASCLMTRWDMHDYYDSFVEISEAAITVAEGGALAVRTHPDGTINPIKLYLQESWGLIYEKGHICKAHTHWPSVWSYTYCVKACDTCAPLVFPSATGGGYEIFPVTSQLIVFPSWVSHAVPEHKCDHERIMISGNLDVRWD
jgi:hypothetical protein|tara:strand:- start:56 stop:640 length:585 start_codon:yes stop_codon:yes gene_type:complete